MITSVSDIDLKYFKEHHARLYYFGLGFIQLKLNETERLHFYSPKLPAITEDIHNHRYGFLSRVLKGEITNNTYVAAAIGIPGGSHVMVSESCNPEIEAPTTETPCVVFDEDSQRFVPGQSYVITPSMYHIVEAKDCITYLIRTHKVANFAQIILPVGKEPVCPFSKKIPEGELWEIMHEMVAK